MLPLLLPFIVMAWAQTPVPKAEIPYRILQVTKTPKGASQRLTFLISVRDFLDQDAVERVVCQLLQKEKPPQVPELGIGIYQGLESISSAALALDREPYEHDIALYLWSFAQSRLSLLRDPQGARLVPIRIYEFDHVKSCPKP